MKSEPSTQELSDIEAEETRALAQPLAAFDPLEDLFTDAMLAQERTPVRRREADPSLRNALAATSRKMKEVFSLPENWERTRGVAVIDRDTATLVGNFSEYVHRSVKGCRKLLREHSPISVSGTEYVSGWLGESMALRRGEWGSREDAYRVKVTLFFDELAVGAPDCQVIAWAYLGGIRRVELVEDTQFAGASGNVIISLPACTNVWEAMDHTSKAALRKETGL